MLVIIELEGHRPVKSGYRPNVFINDKYYSISFSFPQELIKEKEKNIVNMEFIAEPPKEAFTNFVITEGTKLVGEGSLLKGQFIDDEMVKIIENSFFTN